MDTFLMVSGFVLLSMLLACTGLLMVASPRRFAAACEAFMAAGNLPSLLPQSVKRAVLQVRAMGVFLLAAGLLLVGGSAGFMQNLLALGRIGSAGRMDWLIVPAALGISAGYVILVYGSEWVARTFGAWMDHPLVPQEIIVTLTWELRIAGVAFTLFGLGAGATWLRSFLGR